MIFRLFFQVYKTTNSFEKQKDEEIKMNTNVNIENKTINEKLNVLPCGYMSDYWTCSDCAYSDYDYKKEMLWCGRKREWYPCGDRICREFEEK